MLIFILSPANPRFTEVVEWSCRKYRKRTVPRIGIEMGAFGYAGVSAAAQCSVSF